MSARKNKQCENINLIKNIEIREQLISQVIQLINYVVRQSRGCDKNIALFSNQIKSNQNNILIMMLIN